MTIKACTLGIVLALGAAAQSATIFGSAYLGPGNPASLYSISTTNGNGTLIGVIGFTQVSALTFCSNGTLYGVGRSGGTWSLITINTTTGAGTAVGSTGGQGPFQDLACRPSDGVLFGVSDASIYTLNKTTGAATFVGDTNASFIGNGLAFSSANVLYVADDTNLYTVNQSNGSTTAVTALNIPTTFCCGDPRPNGMKFDASGTLFASVTAGNGPGGGEETVFSPAATKAPRGTPSILFGNYLATINIATGAVTMIGPTVAGLDAIAIGVSAPPVAVPAPSSALLLAAGLIVLLASTFLMTARSRS